MLKDVKSVTQANELSLKIALNMARDCHLASELESNPDPGWPFALVTLNDLPDNHPYSMKRCLATILTNGMPASTERIPSDVFEAVIPGLLYVPGTQITT